MKFIQQKKDSLETTFNSSKRKLNLIEADDEIEFVNETFVNFTVSKRSEDVLDVVQEMQRSLKDLIELLVFLKNFVLEKCNPKWID